MTTVAIISEQGEDGGTIYRAVADSLESSGRTAGEALDSLTARLGEPSPSGMLIVRCRQPDVFFTADDQQRLAELMRQWRTARDAGTAMPSDLRAELDRLVEKELLASARRAESILNRLPG